MCQHSIEQSGLVTLTFDSLTLKVVSVSCATWATSVPLLVFLHLSVVNLGPMYATDKQTLDKRLTYCPHLLAARHNYFGFRAKLLWPDALPVTIAHKSSAMTTLLSIQILSSHFGYGSTQNSVSSLSVVCLLYVKIDRRTQQFKILPYMRPIMHESRCCKWNCLKTGAISLLMLKIRKKCHFELLWTQTTTNTRTQTHI